jgi:hypothetical protein
MPRAKLLYNYEQVTSCVRPPIDVPAFAVSWFALLNVELEQGFFHFINCNTMLDPDLFFDFESDLQLIEVHIGAPLVVILGHRNGQSRQTGKEET